MPVDVAELWGKFKSQADLGAKETLIASYLPLVRQIAVSIIKKLRPGVDLDDLISDGTFGLMRAVEQFDPGRGVKFETYATPVVRGAIYNGLRALDWMPERTRGKARALQRAMEKFSVLYGRPGTEEELAEELKMSTSEVYELITDLGCVYLLSLDQPFPTSDDDEASILDIIEDKDGTDPSIEIEFIEQREILRRSVEELSERERTLIQMHYFDGVPFDKIAQIMGVSKQRISQIHSRAVRRLREQLSMEGFREGQREETVHSYDQHI
ncbi:MAG: FliA/WhiG family RNA polymerase sigma factor [Candidatus Eremiobacteraeota bacterium]|nr:FliA/WhiG family RNA polymerase sigma factor [Candidatus Eremiobacteraeota bacterium]